MVQFSTASSRRWIAGVAAGGLARLALGLAVALCLSAGRADARDWHEDDHTQVVRFVIENFPEILANLAGDIRSDRAAPPERGVRVLEAAARIKTIPDKMKTLIGDALKDLRERAPQMAKVAQDKEMAAAVARISGRLDRAGSVAEIDKILLEEAKTAQSRVSQAIYGAYQIFKYGQSSIYDPKYYAEPVKKAGGPATERPLAKLALQVLRADMRAAIVGGIAGFGAGGAAGVLSGAIVGAIGDSTAEAVMALLDNSLGAPTGFG